MKLREERRGGKVITLGPRNISPGVACRDEEQTAKGVEMSDSHWCPKVRAALIRELMHSCFLGRPKATRIIDYLREEGYLVDYNLSYPYFPDCKKGEEAAMSEKK